ncbi:MAG: O-antigen ligase family protein [Candidatus Berkelbacteria bacterium]|nr:O-antigen ligase family protein [Candidatus Berkelbacteria bacterium]
MVRKILNSGWLIVLFFLFLPFERLLTLDIGGLTAKISFVFLFLIFLAFLFERPNARLLKADKIILAFAGLSYLTCLWSIDLKRSLVISTIFLAVILGFIAVRRYLDENLTAKIKSIIIYSGFALCLFALWQYFGDLHNLPLTFLRPEYAKAIFGFPRPQATFLEPLYFANFLFLPIFFTIERIIAEKKLPIFYIVNLFLLALVLALTLSRGAYIGLLAAIIFLVAITIWKFRDKLKSVAIIVGVIILGFAAATGLVYLTAPRASFNLAVSHSGAVDIVAGGQNQSRLDTSKLALQKFQKNIFGLGAGAFGALPEFSEKLATGQYQTVNNLYLEILAEEGVIGLLLFAAFLILFVRAKWTAIKSKSFADLIYLSIFIAIFVQALSFSTLYILPIWGFLALAWSTRRETV